MRALNIALATLLLAGCASLKPDLISIQRDADNAYAGGDFARAADGYEKLADAMPNDAGVRYLLANSLARQGKTNEAVIAYRETLVRDPQHARAWHNLLQTQLRDARFTADELLSTLNSQQPYAERAISRAESLLKLNQASAPAESSAAFAEPKSEKNNAATSSKAAASETKAPEQQSAEEP